MEDIRLFHEKLLRLGPEWKVGLVSVDEHRKGVNIHISYQLKEWPCPETGEVCKVHDYRDEREWRHLDSMGYATYIHCRLPRVKNSFGKVKTVGIYRAEPGEIRIDRFSGFNFYGYQCIPVINNDVNFMPCLIPPLSYQ